MRGWMAAGLLVLLSACNENAAENVVTSDGDVVSETLRGNDVTAIDAATNDAANMAADVEFTLNEGELANEAEEAEAPETNETR